MARKSQPQPLTLPDNNGHQEHEYIDSPRTPLSLKSPKSPTSLFRFPTKKPIPQEELPSMQVPDIPNSQSKLPQSQTQPALHHYRGEEENQDREKPIRGGFFSNYKASKSQKSLDQKSVGETMSRDADRPIMPEKVSGNESTTRNVSGVDKSLTRRPVGGPSRSDISLSSVTDATPSTNNNNNNNNGSGGTIKKKPKPFSLLNRTRSIRGDEHSPREPSPSNKQHEPDKTHPHKDSIKTAPLRSDNDRSFRDMMASNIRQHSADRLPTRARDMSGSREPKERARQPTSLSNSFREGGGFLNNLKSSATKGAGALSKGLFGKSSRSGSTVEREAPVDDEHYQLKVICKPLVEQTRITRMSKRLEESKDKTEFWMPALPWRAIDYLNYKGSDVEGLYRVPGSGPQIKKWQRRFDEELDIDLFEQDELYDINIVGSMLKAWLRELPDELLPKVAQDRIARACGKDGSDKVPQALINELSNLSPFNYYLLFAITCHLSLLLAHSDKNKMDYRNLCICFQPCMKIDAFCFKYLVCDWRDCWKGCLTEEKYTEIEYSLFDTQEPHPPNSAEGTSSTAVESHDERNVSSSDSSKPSSVGVNDQKWSQSQIQNQQNRSLPLSQTQGSLSTISTTLTVVPERTPPRRNADMRPLSPIKPLSPIGL